MKTMNYIAKVAGVARSTVSMALSNSSEISEETKLKIQAIAKQLNYTPNSIARALATNKTRTLGLITVSGITNPFFTKVFIGIQEIAYKRNYNVLFYSTDVSQEKELAAIRMFINKGVDGLMIFPKQEDIEDIKYLIESKFPFVLFSRHFPDGQLDDQINYVISDHEKGAYELTSHLIKAGHKRIAYVGFSSGSSTSQERLTGYKRALSENSISVNEELIFLTPVSEIDNNLPHVVSNILALKDSPSAIFVVDDEEALKVMQLLKEKGIKIPEDLAVAGYDNIEYFKFSDPPLTTVDQQGYEIGKKTAELLLDKIEGRIKGVQHIVLEPKLVVRKSCGAYLKSNQ